MHHRICLQRGTNHLVDTLQFECSCHHPAGLTDLRPFGRKRLVQPICRGIGDIDQMHRAVLAGETLQPDFFHGEHQDWRQPGGQTVEQDIKHGPGGAGIQRVAVTIQRILAHIKVEGGKVDGGKGKDRLPHPVEIKGFIAVADLVIQLGQTVQHPLLQLGHIRSINALIIGEIMQRTQHIAHGVAQATIAVGGAFQDLRADALIRGIIGLRHPEPQDIGAVLFDDLLGDDGIAQRFGHFVALAIQGKPVGNNVFIGRAALGAAGLQQR